MRPRVFALYRSEDVSGVSGTGLVAWGCVFPNGKAVLTWNSGVMSVGVYDSVEELEAIHGHGGSTRIVWVSDIDNSSSVAQTDN
ncbi:hypothetical protein [Actinopolymorpha alba]|uniref:hypothetical protein n=1 Tax=Actinopolymorpha alba TaxID=533267 RepID=UPI00058B73AD|nr:hypothetical protein [Actinopolymorpha alba]